MMEQNHDDLDTAAEATRAVNQIPRRTKEEGLLRTLDIEGLAVRSNTRHYDLQGTWTKTVAEFVLNSRPTTLSAVVGFVRETLQLLKFSDQGTIVRTCVAVTELLDNALYHGNLELSSDLREDDGRRWNAAVTERLALSPYKDRSIFVRTELSQREAVVTIRDEGQGFNPQLLPNPTDPNNLGHSCGRGVFLVRTFMDEVRYNDKGNEVTLVKRAG